MGQQQLLLLVLATVIVGIATVVGIQAFSQNSVKANADALMNDAVRIASDVQAWSQKGQPFGGPTTFGDVDAATLASIGYGGTSMVNQNGTFTLNSGCVTGTFSETDGTTSTTVNEVKVHITGISESDIDGAITTINKQTGAADPCS